MSQADLVELVHDLQTQLSLRGAGAFRTLELSFIVNDRDHNGLFDFQEVEAILQKAGLFLKRQNLTRLYRYFDREQNERVYFPELLDAIRGSLSSRRKNILHQVFDALDVNQHGAVDVQRIIQSFSPIKHPQVLSGEKKTADIAREFATAFDGAGASNNGAVTREEFIRFYHGISAATPYDDEYFVNVVERCWNVKESIPASLLPAVLGSPAKTVADTRQPLLNRVRPLFREKIRQKTLNTKSEVENLRLVFKHFDLEGQGQINFSNFQRALERFGINLDAKTLSALFQEFDDGTGKIDYLAFATALYQEDQTSAAFHQFQRSQTIKAATLRQEELERPLSRRSYVDSSKVLVSSPDAPATAADGDLTASQVLRKSATIRRTLSQRERESSVLPTVVFVFGGPGSGKQTQIARVVREFGFVHLSIDSLIKAEAANRISEAGALLRSSAPVPSDLLVNLVTRAIQENVHKGSLYFIVSGFPNTVAQREAWEKATSTKIEVPFAVYLETSQQVMETRLLSRARQNRTAVDTAATKAAFTSFARDTIGVVNAFGAEGRLQVVDASGTPDVVYKQVQTIIAEL